METQHLSKRLFVFYYMQVLGMLIVCPVDCRTFMYFTFPFSANHYLKEYLPILYCNEVFFAQIESLFMHWTWTTDENCFGQC